MNKKSLIVTFLLMVFMAPMAHAGFWSEYDKVKAKVQNADAKVTASRNAAANAKSDTIKELKSQKAEALKTAKAKIKAKEAEIKSVEKATMLETERKIRLKALNADLAILKKQYDSTASYYDKKINALK